MSEEENNEKTEKKFDKSKQKYDDAEISQIESDFKQIFGEMCELVSNPMFTDIFKQLHTLLMNSHKNNKKLTEIVQALNGNVVSNATKVSSLLKMSEDDQMNIDRYKEEYNRACNVITTSQQNEAQALEICTHLRNQIDKLNQEIHAQSESENKIVEVKSDITSFLNEIQQAEHEREVITSDIYQVQAKVTILKKGRGDIENQIEDLEELIKKEEMKMEKTVSSKTEKAKEIEEATKEVNESKNTIEENRQKIKEIKNNIESTRQEIIRFKSAGKEYKLERETIDRKIQMNNEIKNKIVHSVNRSQNKVDNLQRKYENICEDLKDQKVMSSKLDEIIRKNEDEYAQVESVETNLSNQVQELLSDRNKKNQQILDLARMTNKVAVNIRSGIREGDFTVVQIQKMKTQLKNEQLETKAVNNIAKIVNNTVASEKSYMQNEGFNAHQLEIEAKGYKEKIHEAKVNLIRLNDNYAILLTELDSSRKKLQKLEKDKETNDRYIANMRYERDIISNQIEGIQNENTELNASLNAKNQELLKLKKDIQKKTEDIINIHFQTRSVEKQNNALNGIISMTKRLIEEGKSTIVGYKAEGAKLRLIYDEAHKDITIAKGELNNIVDVSRVINRQLSLKKEEIKKAQNDALNVECQLKRSYTLFEKQTDELQELNDELEHHIYQNRVLKKKSDYTNELKFDSVTLEAKLQNERAIRNKFEQEFERPLNVHRWTILQEMSPNIYKQITMIQYLKHKLEVVQRKQIKLNEKKAELQRRVNINNHRMKNCKIEDGKYAINVMKEAISKKKKELNDMENELKSKQSFLKQMQETLNLTKLKIKQSHITTTSIKRQMTKNDIPTLPINTPKFIEKTRLGGGFNLATQKDKINDKFPKTSRPELKRKVPSAFRSNNDDDDFISSSSSSHFSARGINDASDLRRKKTNKSLSRNDNNANPCDYPTSSRTISAQSWKPKKNNANTTRFAPNNDLSVKPTISIRPNSEASSYCKEPIRRKPMKTAPKAKLETDSFDFNPTSTRPKTARRSKVTKEKPSSRTSRMSDSCSLSSSSSKRQISFHITTIDTVF